MSILEEMQSLTQEIIGSHGARMADITALRGEVSSHRREARTELQELGSARQARAQRQQTDLARGEGRRKSQANTWLMDVASSRQATAQRQRTDLAQHESQRKSQVNTFLTDAASSRQAMAQQQQADLNKGRADLAHGEGRCKSQVNSWLTAVASSHAAVQNEWRQMAVTLQANRASSATAEVATPADATEKEAAAGA